jgi:hypothetical protein
MFAAVCTVLAVAGHLVAGRTTAAPRAMVVVGFVALYLVAWVLTGTERSLATILGGLLGGQFILHALFAAVAAPAAVPAAEIVGGHSMRPMPTTGPDAGGAGGGLTMTIAHIAAALVAAWWLRRGERAAWTLARRTAAMAAYPVRAFRSVAALADAASLDVPLAPAGRYDATPQIRPTSAMLRDLVTRRGPPFGSTAFTCR